jgi:hypothetical protein
MHMKKLISLLLFLEIVVGTVYAAKILVNHDVVGEWKYEVVAAPYDYQKGVITLTENKSALAGEVKFDTGNKVQLKTVVIEGKTLKLGLYVENEYVTLTASINGEKMEGTVDTSQGKMAFKADKKR